MKVLLQVIVIGGLCLLSGLEVSAQTINEQLLGVWIYQGSSEYDKAILFHPEKEGIAFHTNGKVIIRKNVSGCSESFYEEYEGKWKQTADNEIKINIKMTRTVGLTISGKKYKIRYQIQELTATKLRCFLL